MPSSARKTRANRENGRKSRGPTTAEGKDAVKYNALKHGVLVREVVLPGENREQFDTLHAALWAEWNPVGATEEILVERIAVCHWRQRRLLRCEAGETAKRHLALEWRKEAERQQALVEATELLDWAIYSQGPRNADEQAGFEERLASAHQARVDLAKSSQGLEYLIGKLDELWRELDKPGELPEMSRQGLSWYLRHALSFPGAFDPLTPVWEQKAPPPGKKGKSLPRVRKQFLAIMVLNELLGMKFLKGTLAAAEKNEAEARKASSLLPPRLVAEKLLRYEASIERELYRAIAMLEHLQDQRRARERGQLSA